MVLHSTLYNYTSVTFDTLTKFLDRKKIDGLGINSMPFATAHPLFPQIFHEGSIITDSGQIQIDPFQSRHYLNIIITYMLFP